MSLSAERPLADRRPGYPADGAFTRRLGVIAAAATFLMLLAMTIGTAFGARAVLNSQSQQRFADVVTSASNSVRADLDRSFTEIAAVEAFIRSESELTNNGFQIFASTVSQRSAGSEALGFAPRVRGGEATAFIERLNDLGVVLQEFDDSSLLNERFPVAYMFPPVPGLIEPGVDILSDPRFGATVRDSLRARSPIASAPTALRTNPSGQSWFLVFQPVFGDPEPGQLPSEGPLLGYAFGVYRAAEFLAGPLGRNNLDGVRLRVLDTTPGRGATQIFPEPVADADESLAHGWAQAGIEFAGRRWNLQFETPERFGLSALERNVWVIVLSAGLGLTVFASVSMFSLLKSRSAAHSSLDLMASQIRVIVGSAIEGIVVLDAANRIVLANRSFADAFGMPDPDQLARKDWSAVRESAAVEFAGRDGFFALLGQVSNSQNAAIAAADVRIKAPVERTLSMSSSPVSDASGQYLGRLFVFRDVTAERSAEEAKTDFISMVSHELRTPLTSIVGYVDLLMEGADGLHSPESVRLLGIVKRNSNRLARLVADILDLSRIDNARFDLDPGSVDLASLITELTESMSAEFRAKDLSVVLELDAGMPPAHVDRIRIGQVFTNLLSNAYRYTPSGGAVTVRASAHDANFIVSFKDTGVGISPEDRPKLFERFARINRNGTRPSGSTGLGLAITKALVELHGGTIGVESSPGNGSTFTVVIPRKAAENAAA
ncbi:MAG: ATP-binding protein [Chloroflexi bacterium]|nr:ATP-binding protein [Chloroflexota bacterium]